MKKTKGRIISILISFCMLLSMISSMGLTAFAEDVTPPTDTWDNHAANSFDGGTGTQDDPYQIATAEQLAKLANDVNNKDGLGAKFYLNTYFVLTANIDLSGYRWKPIGVYQEGIANTRFSGCLDGDGHTISGLYVDERESGLSAGLFGCIGVAFTNNNKVDIEIAPTVKNLTIEGAEIYASDYLPSQYSSRGYAGILTGMTTHYYSKSIIDNVHVSGKINATSKTDNGVYCGGMIGNCYNLMATNCSADVIIDGGNSTTSGGFIGFVCGGKFENCTTRGSMDGKWGLGGFAGEVDSGETHLAGADPIIDSEFNKCISYVNITAVDWNVGGFVGYLNKGTISNCASYGNVTSKVTEWNPRIGGFAGTNAGTIKNSHTASIVTENSEEGDAGGFVGNDKNGITSTCSFDNTKNAEMNAIGGSETEGTNEITGVPTAAVLANICRDVFGKHSMTHYQAVAATCTQVGNMEYWHCSVCNNNYDSANGGNVIDNVETAINPDNHKAAAEWTQENNKHYHKCENGCNTHLDEESCSGGTATCTAQAICEICKRPYGNVPGHDWNDTTYEWGEDGKTCTASRTCKNDSTHIETAKATVTGTQTKAPTCTEKGETTYTAAFDVNWASQQTKTVADIDAAGHTYVHRDEAPATHEFDGKAEHYTCGDCELLFDKDKNVVTAEDLVLAKIAHSFGTDWKFDEEKHWHECSCGAKTEESNHTFEWKIDKEAQVGAAGSKHEECTECGYKKAAVEIPALKAPEYPPVVDNTDGGKVTVDPENPQAGDEVTITTKPEDGKTVDKVIVTDENGKEIAVTDNGDGTYTFTQPDGKVTIKVKFGKKPGNPDSPQTGDNSNMILWIALLFVSGASLTGMAVIGKKRKTNK